MALQSNDDAIDVHGGGRKRKKVIEGGNCSLWSELPAVLLELILGQLRVIEFLMFACVCKSWRAVAIALKQEFMASQGPLVFLMSKNARKYCYFYNIFDKSLHRTTLPHLPGNKCLGFTCGYLVLRDSQMTKQKDSIWLVNPFTRHELKFPRPPKRYSSVILASLAKSVDQQYVVVAYSKTHPFIQFCRSGNADWTVYDYGMVSWMILDVAVFKGKIYVMTSHGRLGILSLNSKNHPKMTLMQLSVKNVIYVSAHDHVNLVAYHQCLYVSSFRPEEGLIKICRLDFEKMVWEEVKMNGEVLFIADMKSSGFSFPTPLLVPSEGFVGEQPLNRVCYVGEEGRTFSGHTAVYVAGRQKKHMLATRRDGKPDIFLSSPFWYFPHLSCSVDPVYED